MSVPITVGFANPEPGVCPGTFGETVGLLNTLLSGSIPSPFTPYVVSEETPAVDQQAYLWVKLNGAGQPLGLFKYYGGNWRRVHNGVPGEVRMFKGDPTGKFDGTGKGILQTDWDGWALCNGSNGTTNLTDRFIISAHMDGSGGTAAYTAGIGWRTKVRGTAEVVGGQNDITLTDLTTYRPPRPELKRWQWKADGNSGTSGGNLYGGSSVPGISEVLLPADAGNETPDPISIIPPFYSFALCEWVGYS